MEFLIVLAAIIALFFDFAIAKVFEDIAYLKGHNGKKYFWCCFCCGTTALGIVGYLMVIALPDRGKQVVVDEKPKASEPEELPEI